MLIIIIIPMVDDASSAMEECSTQPAPSGGGGSDGDITVETPDAVVPCPELTKEECRQQLNQARTSTTPMQSFDWSCCLARAMTNIKPT